MTASDPESTSASESSCPDGSSASDLDGKSLLPPATEASLDLVRHNVPVELRALPIWVCGDRSPRMRADGSIVSSKVPLDPATGRRAKSNDPSTWATFDEACGYALGNPERCFGVGVNVLGSEFVGLDLDHVIDPETGEPMESARDLIDSLPTTYTEVSPSGTGLRLFFKGALPEEIRGKNIADAFGVGTALECYDGQGGARYLTVTGRVFDVRTKFAEATPVDLRPLVELQERVRGTKAKGQSDRRVDGDRRTRGDLSHRGQRDSDHDRARWGLLEARLLDPDMGYADWLRVIVALKAIEPGREGLALAINWSRGGAKFEDGEIESKWQGLEGSSSGCLFGMFDDADSGWRQRYWRRGIHSRCAPDSQAANDNRQDESGDHDEDDDDDPHLEAVAKRKRPKQPSAGERLNGRLVLDPQRTLPTAQAYIREHHLHEGVRTFHAYAEMIWVWNGSRYVQLEEAALRNRLQEWLHDAWTVKVRKGDENGEWWLEWTQFQSNRGSINSAVSAVVDYTHIPADTTMPSWVEQKPDAPPASELLPCKSAILHLPTRQLLPATPRLFATSGIDFDYDADAPPPTSWLEFLHELFGDDREAIELLQEWMGYSLTSDTDQQKMLLVVGPQRSGKGTIARVLRELVGVGNVAGPTVSSLSGSFGLQPLIGKALAVVSDARFKGEGVMTVVERLLCISGEDLLTIDRKHRESVTMKLGTRFVFLTNELPRFTDMSSALPGRFVILQLTQSFYGREDHDLTARLLSELPGILNWALDGLDRLRARGRFVPPASSAEAVEELDRLSSPIRAFLADRCVVSEGQSVRTAALFEIWQRWCADQGRDHHGTAQTFGRDLRAAVPKLRTRQGGDGRFYDGVGLL